MVAMSGGVDSSVAAALLKNQGYDVVGVFMRFWSESPKDNISLDDFVNRCCSLESERAARSVAEIIGIPFYSINVVQEFKKAIVDHFLREYGRGVTPNPCVVCNKEIKFKFLIEKAKSMGADLVATGHYARRGRVAGRGSQTAGYKLLKAKDRNKDQSYFLYNITQFQLVSYLFPIGDYLKPEVRKLAKKFKLPTWDRRESQEICFISDNDIKRFLSEYLHLKPGNIADVSGKIIGTHKGLALFTIGQRQGLGIGGGKPYYVVKLNRKKNQLVVTSNPKDSLLFRNNLTVKNVNWISGKKPKLPLQCLATVRYRHKPEKAMVTQKLKKYRVDFAKPQRAVTSGQSVVFYQGQEVLGGGVIGL